MVTDVYVTFCTFVGLIRIGLPRSSSVWLLIYGCRCSMPDRTRTRYHTPLPHTRTFSWFQFPIRSRIQFHDLPTLDSPRLFPTTHHVWTTHTVPRYTLPTTTGPHHHLPPLPPYNTHCTLLHTHLYTFYSSPVYITLITVLTTLPAHTHTLVCYGYHTRLRYYHHITTHPLGYFLPHCTHFTCHSSFDYADGWFVRCCRFTRVYIPHTSGSLRFHVRFTTTGLVLCVTLLTRSFITFTFYIHTCSLHTTIFQFVTFICSLIGLFPLVLPVLHTTTGSLLRLRFYLQFYVYPLRLHV